MLYETRKTIKLAETVFDILYLGIVLISAYLFLFDTVAVGSLQWEFGCLALVLAIGDAFHLIPRIRAMWCTKPTNHLIALGLGKMISSITMTLFYLGLWHIGIVFYEKELHALTAVVLLLAVIRIILCLLPQNKWTSEETSTRWPLWRNLPFFLLGLAVMALFAVGATEKTGGVESLWLAVFVTFTCYMPVVLFSNRYPKVGMLMIPKSCAYIAIILMGFSLPSA
jgi:hypothetical protein